MADSEPGTRLTVSPIASKPGDVVTVRLEFDDDEEHGYGQPLELQERSLAGWKTVFAARVGGARDPSPREFSATTKTLLFTMELHLSPFEARYIVPSLPVGAYRIRVGNGSRTVAVADLVIHS